MKDLNQFYSELRNVMEEKVSSKELNLHDFIKKRKRKRLPLITAAAMLLFIPFMTITVSSYFQERNLINRENRYFIQTLFEEDHLVNDYQSVSLLETDWFDTSESLFDL